MLIAGPCSAESEEQVLATALGLRSSGVRVDFFRAGLWKPRSRPATFQGVGKRGIPWLQRVERELAMPVVTEVGNASHVEQILAGGISAFWVGARTVSNPFSVQEIVSAAAGSHATVFVKNPLFPDIDLWVGAVERFLAAGFDRVFAVHRGFFPYTTTKLRNSPMWEVPIAFARRMPQIPILCDPSHIAGNAAFIGEIAQQAINLNMNGLMIETHCCPAEAKSDTKQQITPLELKSLLQNLTFKRPQSADNEYVTKINELRSKIDVLDFRLIDLLADRFALTDQIGDLKRRHNVAVLQLDRWEEIIDICTHYADKLNISPTFIFDLLQCIHQESIDRQK